jgi:threonine aldolase
MFGGGMRQAGIIAAGALYALDNHRARLAQDHANAKTLARGLAAMPGVSLNVADVETNIVVFKLNSLPAATMVDRLKHEGVWMMATGPDTVRAVVCLEVNEADIQAAIRVVNKCLQND